MIVWRSERFCPRCRCWIVSLLARVNLSRLGGHPPIYTATSWCLPVPFCPGSVQLPLATARPLLPSPVCHIVRCRTRTCSRHVGSWPVSASQVFLGPPSILDSVTDLYRKVLSQSVSSRGQLKAEFFRWKGLQTEAPLGGDAGASYISDVLLPQPGEEF